MLSGYLLYDTRFPINGVPAKTGVPVLCGYLLLFGICWLCFIGYHYRFAGYILLSPLSVAMFEAIGYRLYDPPQRTLTLSGRPRPCQPIFS